MITYVRTAELKHIEGYSKKRVTWLVEKILREGVWTMPVVVDTEHALVMDGQHRMEAAKSLGLAVVPAIVLAYSDVEVWSLRPNQYTVSAEEITLRSLSGNIYPYKTAKHRFPIEIPKVRIPLSDLKHEDLAKGHLMRIVPHQEVEQTTKSSP